MSQITTNRRQARQLGMKKYWTNKPCLNGHSAPRYTSSGACVTCNARRCNRIYEKNKSRKAMKLRKIEVWAYAGDVETIRDTAQYLLTARLEALGDDEDVSNT